MRKWTTGLLSGALAFALAGPAAGQTTVLDWNTGAEPFSGLWGADEVGWYYTPSSDVFVNFLGTRFKDFATSTDREVIAEVRTDRGAGGGTVLASGTFNSSTARSAIGGATFSNILMNAGTSYFLGFRNISGLGVNVTSTAGSAGPDTYWWGLVSDGNYGTMLDPAFLYARPILEMRGTPADVSVTPEPVSMALLGTGLFGVGIVGRRRRKKLPAA